MSSTRVGIVMGSQSDEATMRKAAEVLTELGIGYEFTVTSAHRNPERTAAYARGAAQRGIQVLIAGAGLAAALPGILAAHTTLPVIGVPLAAGALNGVDALYSMVQMPSGIPVATVGIDNSRNAALLAAQILSVNDVQIAAAVEKYRAKWN